MLELANKIGYDLAMSLTKGKHAFIFYTHVDKHHIHSHIVFNPAAIDYTRMFQNFWRSSFAIREIFDMLCLENGLSVIVEPKPSRETATAHGWVRAKRLPFGVSWRS